MNMYTASNNLRSRQGFTLIELLVVIAIISILATILLPALSQAQHLAKNVSCTSQQRSIMMAILFHADENNSFLPYQSLASEDIMKKDVEWGQQIVPFLETVDPFFCPAHSELPFGAQDLPPSMMEENYYRLWMFGNVSSYGYNYLNLGYKIFDGQTPARYRTTDIAQPANTLAIADGCYNDLRKGWSAILVPANMGFTSWGGLWSWDRHKTAGTGSANFGMLDGHIENCEANTSGHGAGTRFGDLQSTLWDRN